MNLLDIKDPSFLKKLKIKELKALAQDIRDFLIENISKTGGHLASNLGVVELTIAIYYVFDIEDADIIFDVGHQSYVSKILTGRAKDFKTLRKFNGLSGYVSKEESEYDVWESGHSSTSISAASGFLVSSNKRPIVVIGDSSITNGVAFEGLNYLGQNKKYNPIIILNDNKMGISKSVGAMSKLFLHMRSGRRMNSKNVLTKILPNKIVSFCHRVKKSIKSLFQHDNIFEDFGFDYYGPYKGHDIKSLIKLFQRVKKDKEPLLIHILTEKGHGYDYAENNPEEYHGVSPFDIKTGKPLNNHDGEISYSEVCANYLLQKRKNNEFFVITPAMSQGACLKQFSEIYPDSFIDVGIAEENAAVMSSAISQKGKEVVLLMYSTFSQRAFDYFLNDIARNNTKVIIGIDRAGIVGEDGPTHQGLYDVSMFMMMPNFIVSMASNSKELVGLFNFAFKQDKPMVIRYPRRYVKDEDIDINYEVSLSWDILNEGNELIIIGYGDDIIRINNIVKNNNLDVMVVNARFIKPLDYDMLDKLFNMNKKIICFEQIIRSGTLFHQLLEYKEKKDYKSKIIPYSFDVDTVIKHGSINDVYDNYGLSDDDLLKMIKDNIKN